MTFLLLTGAGFSYNWGGPLASDVFSALLADRDLDEHTRDLLFDSNGAFEKVLADLHLSTDRDDQRRHEALVTAVAGIFYGMNNTFMHIFMHIQFEFENPPARQDKFAVMEPNPPFGTFGTGAQPYVKLHGSVNWSESNMGKRILIMGGQKAVSIGRHPILTWYHDEFRKMLLQPSARLMVIGYSFSDTHINDAIVDGIAAGLKLFVVDPYALKVLKNDPRIGSARSSLTGYSDRPLKTTFGGDRYAHAQISKFLFLS